MVLAEVFRDPDTAQRIRSRLSLASDTFERVGAEVERSPDPDRAIANLDRWLSATGDLAARVDSLASDPALCHRLCFLLGASQALADVLIQNPELATLLSDTRVLSECDDVHQLFGEGKRLISSAISFTHSLDRIRYLKQKHLVKLVWNDLSSIWLPHAVWQGISAIADAVLQLTADVVWQDMGGEGELPVAAIAMGKHGTSELNYSSDIDLVYVCADDADIDTCSKFCEKYTRALEGKMGRGSLYRIDLRLRPLGAAGPIVQSLRSARTYYESYCEPWEILAMLKARACAGNREVGATFVESVRKEVFRGARSEMFLESIVESKKRYEAVVRESGGDSTHIKLGTGAIRDIEFLVQLHQLLSGHEIASLQGADTLDALSTLKESGVMNARRAGFLSDSYALYRQVEHRIQLRHDLQTHSLPKDDVEREVLAKLVGVINWKQLDQDLRERRTEVRAIVESDVPLLSESVSNIDEELSHALGFASASPEADLLLRLVQHADDAALFARQLRDDGDTRERTRFLVSRAPRVANEICYHQELWDVAFSEEVEQESVDETEIRGAMASRLATNPDKVSGLGAVLRREFAATCLKFAFHGDVRRTFARLTALADASLVSILDSVGGEDIDVIGMGRLGGSELSLPSDWDVMLLVHDDSKHARAERIGEEWLREGRKVAMSSGYYPIDVRLRPEGNKGLVVRTAAGFAQYVDGGMETWERLAFTRARSLRSLPETDVVIQKAMYSSGWGWDEETEILAMRERVQSERLRPWERKRDLKLGEGFLIDIEWLCSILRLRHPELGNEPRHTITFLHRLGELGIIGAVEASELTRAMLAYCKLRDALYLLEFESDSLIPENPQKLDRLASHVNSKDGNVLLGEVEEMRRNVSEIFGELVGRA